MKTLVSMVLLLSSALSVHAALVIPDCCWDGPDEKVERAPAPGSIDAALPGTLFNLAADARLRARLPESEVLYNRAIALREAMSGVDSPDLARPLAGLALAYLAEGRFAEAMESADRAVRVSAGRTADVRQAAQAENAFATVLMARGGAVQAEAIELKVAGELSGARAEASQEYVDALTNLGTSRLRMANYRQADVDLHAAEAAALKVGGANHPSTATIWNNLAKSRAAQGGSKEAEGLFLKAIASWRATLGPAHPDVASGMSNLAMLYQSRKRYAEAEKLLKQAIAIDEAAFGADSLRAANDWDNLGALDAVRRHYRDAETAIAKALAIAEAKAGFDHPDTTRIGVNLALLYYSEGRYAQASALFARALPARERALGSESAEMAVILRVYARSLKGVHDYAAAEKVDLRATRIVTKNAL